MTIKAQYFSFKLIEHKKDLEQLRRMRNSAFLHPYMAQKKAISSEEQINWFSHLNKHLNRYFLVFDKDGELIGYCLIKNIDFNTNTGEPGTFLIKEELLETSEAALFMITFLDYCFYELGVQHFFGNVLLSNKRARNNYKHFRPKVLERKENELFLKDSEEVSYLERTDQLRGALKSIFNYKPDFQISNH